MVQNKLQNEIGEGADGRHRDGEWECRQAARMRKTSAQRQMWTDMNVADRRSRAIKGPRAGAAGPATRLRW